MTRFGEPAAVLRLEEADDPTPGPGEILVAMRRMPIDPADLLMINGRYGELPPELPFTPGVEGLGKVIATGPGVSRFKPGDLVVPLRLGTWTTRLVCPERAAIAIPADIDPDQASMLKANPATADLLLSSFVALPPGSWIIQNAANSVVGRWVVVLARERGLRTVNIVRRPETVEPLRALGADVVLIDPGPGEILGAIGRKSALLGLDAIGGEATGVLAASLAEGGTLVVYGMLSGVCPTIRAEDLVFRNVLLRGFWLARWFAVARGEEVRAIYARLLARIANGIVNIPIEACYPLQHAAEAVAHAARPGRLGKILLCSEE